MINATQVLERLNISAARPTLAIQEVRTMVDEGGLKAALDIIQNITGLDVKYEDEKLALHVAQGVVDRAIRQGSSFVPEVALKAAEEQAQKLRANPALTWLFATSPTTQAADGPKKEIAGAQVEMKANGKIKKGGKGPAAYALFVEHVIGKGLSNQEFIKVLEKELDMSKAGATTYAYNSRKEYEKEHGEVQIKKSNKGRKAKK